MGLLDWIIVLTVAALLVLAIRVYRKSGSCSCGSGGCGDCAACRYAGSEKCSCGKRKKQ